MSGRFVTFEGLDGCGKSTHLARVAAWLASRGVPHLVTHEPGGTPLGDALRGVFLDPRWGELDGLVEALLVFAGRRHHLLRVIEPALAEGRHVLCDRFTDSTLAYQGYGRGAPLSSLRELDRLATGGRRPDRTVLLDLPAEEARRRGNDGRRVAGQPDRIDAETLDFYGRLREGYLALARESPERFRVVDASGDAEATARAVRAALADLLGEDP